MATRVGIALGSNLGNRLANISHARDLLCKLMPEHHAHLQAPVFGSAPVDCPPDSPDFLNTVIEIAYERDAHDLLEQTQQIESTLGRESVYPKNAPRPIDIDILYFGDSCLKNEILDIPHPGIASRRFVLEPLAHIRPNLTLPGKNRTVIELLHHLDSEEQPLTLVESDW